MPPEGYESVTLPTELLDKLDDVDAKSRSAAIERLLAEYRAYTGELDPRASEAFAEVCNQLDRIEGDTGEMVDLVLDPDTPATATLEADERTKIAREVAEELQG